MYEYEIFKRLLDEKHLTPYKVHKATGISTATLSDWKNSKSTPKIDKMQKIAEFLGVTVDYLMTGEDKQSDEQQTPDIRADLNDTVAKLSSADTLMFNGMELDEETRKLLLASVESLMANANMMAKIKSENKPKED